MNKDIYVIRHCETNLNMEGKISGGANVPIANFNINLSCFNKEGNTIIVTSPLLRCMQTCDLIRKKIDVNEIIQDERLVERDMGKLDGMEKDKAIKLYPKLFDFNGRFNPYETPPGGESYEEFTIRIKRFYADLKNYLDKNTVIIVSHNQTLKLFYCVVKEIKVEKIWDSMNFKNGELTIL